MNTIAFCGNMIADVVKTVPAWPDKGMLVPIISQSHHTAPCFRFTAV